MIYNEKKYTLIQFRKLIENHRFDVKVENEIRHDEDFVIHYYEIVERNSRFHPVQNWDINSHKLSYTNLKRFAVMPNRLFYIPFSEKDPNDVDLYRLTTLYFYMYKGVIHTFEVKGMFDEYKFNQSFIELKGQVLAMPDRINLALL